MSQKQDLRGYDLDYLYKREQGFMWSDIVDAVHSHAHKYRRGRAGKRNVCVVCPYYFEVDKGISEKIQEQGFVVAKKIESLLENLDRDQFTVVLFDKESEYLRKTHKWAEKGLVDLTVTNRDKYPPGLNLSSDAGFKDSEENYICGIYGSGCIRTVTEGIRWYASYGSVIPIRDAILYAELVRDFTAVFESGYRLVKGVTVEDILNEKPLAHRVC